MSSILCLLIMADFVCLNRLDSRVSDGWVLICFVFIVAWFVYLRFIISVCFIIWFWLGLGWLCCVVLLCLIVCFDTSILLSGFAFALFVLIAG